MTTKDVSYNALGCALWSRLHGQCFQTRWKALEFANLLALQGAFAKVILDNADPARYPAEFVLARVADHARLVEQALVVLAQHELPHAREVYEHGLGLADLLQRLAVQIIDF